MLKTQKITESEKLVKLIENYPIIGIVSIHKMPGRQLQQIKQMLEGKAVIKVSKKTVISHAFEKSSIDGIKKLEEKLDGEVALLLSDANPFKLYRDINKIRSPASAKAGDVALNDIEIKAGPTDLMPGPAITALQKGGLKTKVDAGKIAIMTDKVVCKAGETISADLATVFTMLKMQPMEIGLNVVAILEKGTIYDKSVLAIDEAQYAKDVSSAITAMINLSVFTGYPVAETVELMIQKAYREMKGLGIEANLLEKDVIEDVLIKAEREAKSVESIAKI